MFREASGKMRLESCGGADIVGFGVDIKKAFVRLAPPIEALGRTNDVLVF